ncbi:Helix-turn-helix, AraC domain protein [Burkholderia sp. 8Y]|uniref:helix-turn-helix domain-containing protein n=1 Tax=Burkholderia sp. 8Y TaxID=2653133 RepID=UPI0012F27B49|nr:helix-turn-helix domain-containing protein [Burkholderia sp. 8Y]VXC83039.1 Helix-turn-helix, AraC domain protein [Burkholderia sp. 8Y]
MSTCESPTSVAVRTCHSVEEQAALLDTWNQSYCQISRGVFAGSITTLAIGGFRVHIERLNRTVYQRGEVAANEIAVGIPFQLEGHALLCGQASHRNALHVFSGEGGFEFLSPDQHLVVNLEVSPENIANRAAREQLEMLRPRLSKRAGLIPVASTKLQEFRVALESMLGMLTKMPHLTKDMDIAETFERSAVFGLADVLATEPDLVTQSASRTSRHWQLVRAVRELVEASPDCPLTVAELCVRLRTSRRTLQYAFEEALGINPFSYTRVIRLGKVQRELQSANSVTEAATRWGFWHLGNFSAEYREHFGELPSETLRRYRR